MLNFIVYFKIIKLYREGVNGLFRILKYVTRQKVRLPIAVFFMFLCIGLNLLIPYFTMKLVDEEIMMLDSTVVIHYSALILLVVLTVAVIGYIRNRLFVKIGIQVHQDLKCEIFDHVQTLDTQYFDTTSTGELLSRVDNDIENIWMALDFG